MIGANLLTSDDPENLDKNLDAMKSILEQDKSLSPRALTLFLHKLAMLEKCKTQGTQLNTKFSRNFFSGVVRSFLTLNMYWDFFSLTSKKYNFQNYINLFFKLIFFFKNQWQALFFI